MKITITPIVSNIEVTENRIIIYTTGTFSTGGGGGVSSHPDLTDRDAECSHPQAAITGLVDDLAAKANTSSLATVATSGSYNDLSNTPTIPDAQVNSDWDSVSGVSKILNKPTIPVNSDFTLNGLSEKSYNNLSDTPDLSGYAEKSNVLEKDNTTVFTPTANYHPATKKYVDDNGGGGGGGASFWTELTGCTRTNNSTIATSSDLTGSVSVGDVLRYTTGTGTFYGEVNTINATTITIKGEPVDSAISTIHVSRAGVGIIESHHLVFTGQFAMANLSTLIKDYLLTKVSTGFPARVISFKARATEIDTGASITTKAKINIVDISGNSMFASDVEIETADTWYYSDVADPTYNTLSMGGSFEVEVIAATGTVNNDASNATVIVKTVNTNLG